MTKRFLLLLVAVLATSAVAMGCGNDDKTSSANSTSTTSTMPEMDSTESAKKTSDEGASSGAAALRAGLTSQLQEHVYLAGIAVEQGVTSGLTSKPFKAAAGALDENSVALSKSIESVYGADAGEQFLALWRKHIGFFVNYAKGKATKNSKLSNKALKDLDGYRTDFGAFISSANPNLPADAVADELKPHIETLAAAIDALVAGKASTFDKLQKAAAHMSMTANVLAGGIVKQYPDKFSGSTDAGASQLRAGLTDQLQEHVYLAGIAVEQGLKKGLTSGEFKAAAGTLDANSVALSKSIESVYGADAGKQFLALWRKHIGFFVDYAKGKATKNAKLSKKALKQLDGYRTDFGAFISSANPNLPADAVAEELKPHIETLAAAIDALAAGKTSAFKKLAKAAEHMPMTAEILAGGIAKQYPDKFPSA